MKKNNYYNACKDLIKSIYDEMYYLSCSGELNIFEHLENEAKIKYEKIKVLMKILKDNNIKYKEKKKEEKIIDFMSKFE